jgi:hypothetical protein
MRLRSLLAVIAALALAACGGGTTNAGVPATAEAFIDAATTASAVITSNIAGMLSGSGASLVSEPGNADPTVGCTFSAGHFVCAGTVAGGLSGTATVTLFAANGTAQTAYDPLTTASAQFNTYVFGHTAVGAWDAIVGRHRQLTETGLAGAETASIWNGTGTDTLLVVDSTDGPSRSYTVFSTVTVTSVIAPSPGSDAHWPVTGTITQQLVMAATSGESNGLTFRLTATVTFNGTNLVPLIVGNRSFQLDLGSGVIHETG